MMTYLWEIIPMEGKSTFLETQEDSILAAAKKYEEHYACSGSIYGIRAIRKAAIIDKFEEAI